MDSSTAIIGAQVGLADLPTSPIANGDPLANALYFAGLGHPVYPSRPDGGAAYTKRSTSTSGKNWGASTSPDEIIEWWQRWPDARCHIVTGEPGGYVVIDVDAQHGGIDTYNGLIAAAKARGERTPRGVLVNTPSGGYHIYYAHPGNNPDGTPCAIRTGEIAKGVEIKAARSNITAPGTVRKGVRGKPDGIYTHDIGRMTASGKPGPTFDAPPALPDWLRTLAGQHASCTSTVRTTGRIIVGVDHPPLSDDDAIEALNFLDPNMERQEWIYVGMALHDGLGDLAFAIWDLWSSGATGKKYTGTADNLIQWRSFVQGGGRTIGTLIHHAREAGWPGVNWRRGMLANDPHAVGPMFDTSGWAVEAPDGTFVEDRHPDPNFDMGQLHIVGPSGSTRDRTGDKPTTQIRRAQYELLVPPEPVRFPIQNPLADCPGLLGEVADALRKSSIRSSEAGGLAVAIPTLGAIMGRRYATPTDLRTNIYTVALGSSGSGKTVMVAPAKETLTAIGAEKLIGRDRIASGQGLVASIEETPKQVIFLDEFGHMLQQITQMGASGPSRQILTEFTRLYSAANTIYTGTAYADTKARKANPVHNPHLCLFAMSTPEQFWSAFGSGALEDGSIARYMLMPLGETAYRDPDPACIEALYPRLRAIWLDLDNEGRANENTIVGEDAGGARVVPWGTGAQDIYHKIVATMAAASAYAEDAGIRGAPSILNRVAENACKIALVSAVGRNHIDAEISIEDLNIGYSLALWSAAEMIRGVLAYIADNETERTVNAFERYIQSFGDKGVSKSRILRRFRGVRARDINEHLTALVEQGAVELATDAPNGRPITIFRAPQAK